MARLDVVVVAPSFDQTPEEKFGWVIVQYHLIVIASCGMVTFGPLTRISAPEPALAAIEAYDVVAIACVAASAGSKHYMQPSCPMPICGHYWL